MEPKVLYEDDSMVVIDKPSGLAVHADGKHQRETLTDWLVGHYPEMEQVGEPQVLTNGVITIRPGIVHRLDRETSGVLVTARTEQAFEILKEQFKERQIRKVYRAFVYGPFKEGRGIIDRPIGSGRNGSAPRSARSPYGKTREAVTHYRVIESSSAVTYVEAFPQTGRTHQIRAHFSAIQHPIVCDQLYAPSKKPILSFSRLALHALTLSFVHPVTEKEISFTAPLPQDFKTAETLLREQ